MLTSEDINRSTRPSVSFIRQHLKDHEKGEFTTKFIFSPPINAESILEGECRNLVIENIRLRKECHELKHSFNSQEEVVEIHRLNKENLKLRQQLIAIKSTFQEEKTI